MGEDNKEVSHKEIQHQLPVFPVDIVGSQTIRKKVVGGRRESVCTVKVSITILPTVPFHLEKRVGPNSQIKQTLGSQRWKGIDQKCRPECMH